MGNGYYGLVATVLLVMGSERTGSVQGPCSACPAGTYCGNAKTQICAPCPLNSFSSTSGQKACDICRRCEGVFRTKKACSPTSNAECECISGFRCQEAGCTMCEPDCKQGQEVTRDGCKDCSFGMFNDQKHGVCRPWTDCALHGKTVLVNGTKERDVVCGPRSADFSPGACPPTVPATGPGRDHTPQVNIVLLALAASATLLLGFLLALRVSAVRRGRRKLLLLLKQPFTKGAQTAQEEDASSCRFPEEEEGGGCKP